MISAWNAEEYINIQIEKIKKLQAKGYSDREILDRNEFSFKVLKACSLPLSYLVPKIHGQEMYLQKWDTHTSAEHKWEYYNSMPFGNEHERDRVLIGLLYSMGFKHLLEILPQQAKEELLKLVSHYINKE